MTHFGIICPAMAGHLNTMTTLGYELKKSGHRVTLLGIVDAKPKVIAAGLEFQAIGESDFPAGATKDLYTQLGKLSGAEALQYTYNWVTDTAKMYLRDAPKAAKRLGIEALLVDQATPEGGSVAEHLGIPFISICSALMLNREINVPPFCTLWDYDTSAKGLERNRLGYEKVNGLGTTLRKITNDYRASWGLRLPVSKVSLACQAFQQDAHNTSGLSNQNYSTIEIEIPTILEIRQKTQKLLAKHPEIKTSDFIVPGTVEIAAKNSKSDRNQNTH